MAITVSGSAQDAMFVDSSGNVGIGTNSPETMLEVDSASGNALIQVDNSSSTSALRQMYVLKNNGSVRFTMADTGGNAWAFSIGSSGFSISKAGSGPEALVRNNGNLEISGTLSEGSSRSIKQNITPLDGRALLTKLDELPVNEWSYNSASGVRHIGPMAEDFYAVFGLGSDEKHIAPKDLAGIAVAAAKELKSENEELRALVQSNQMEVRELRAELEKLSDLVGVERN